MMKALPFQLVSGLLAVGLTASFAGAANAGKPNSPGDKQTNTTTPPLCDASFSSSFSFTDCEGAFTLEKGTNDVTNGAADNLVSQKLATGIFGGITNWIYDSKINVGGGKDVGTGTNGLDFGLTSGGGNTTGAFTFDNIDLANTALAISLKAADSYSIFYFAANSLTSNTINWNTLGVSTNKSGVAQGLSHASVYYSKVSTPDPTPVPEPASLLGLGIAAGVGLRLKRKFASA